MAAAALVDLFVEGVRLLAGFDVTPAEIEALTAARPIPLELVPFLPGEQARQRIREALVKSDGAPVAFGSKAETLRVAMEAGHRVMADYTRRDGRSGSYEMAPYERKGTHSPDGHPGDYLYATELFHGDDAIHSFRMGAVHDVKITAETFAPRWPVQPESV